MNLRDLIDLITPFWKPVRGYHFVIAIGLSHLRNIDANNLNVLLRLLLVLL